MRIKIVQIYEGISLRNSEPGLTEFLKSNGIDRNKFKNKECIIFRNTKRNQIKIIGRTGIFSEYILPDQSIETLFKTVGKAFGMKFEKVINEEWQPNKKKSKRVQYPTHRETSVSVGFKYF